MNVLQTSPYRNLLNRELNLQLPSNVLNSLEERFDLGKEDDFVLLDTSSSINLSNIKSPNRYGIGEIGCIINIKRLNDISKINHFLEAANEKLRLGGYLVGCVETFQQRERRLMAKYKWPLNLVYVALDFLAKQIWPLIPGLRNLFYLLTAGRNQIISKMETLGRLFCCGFYPVELVESGGLLYFIAEKRGMPEYDRETSRGSLARLQRVGKNGKPIKVYKVRTMYPFSQYLQQYIFEQNGLASGGKIKDDPRVTPIGKFFRKYWLDELPMLINLMKGDLKIVGVRPISRHYFDLYPEEFRLYRRRFKPGLIPPFYADLPNTLDEIVESEIRYLQAYERHPLLTDLRYLSKAVFNIFLKKARSH